MTSEVESEVPDGDAKCERPHKLHLPDSQQRNIHDSIDPPVHRLPPEVISEILLNVVSGNIRASDSVFIVRHILSCVCSSWREVARSTPALWNKIPSRLHSESLRPSWIDYAKHASEHPRAKPGISHIPEPAAAPKEPEPESKAEEEPAPTPAEVESSAAQAVVRLVLPCVLNVSVE